MLYSYGITHTGIAHWMGISLGILTIFIMHLYLADYYVMLLFLHYTTMVIHSRETPPIYLNG